MPMACAQLNGFVGFHLQACDEGFGGVFLQEKEEGQQLERS